MQAVMEHLAQWMGVETQTVRKLLLSLLLIVVIGILKLVLVRLVSRRVTRPDLQYRLRRTINYSAGIVLLLLIGRIWFTGLHDLGVLLGLAAAGLAIALKEPLLSLGGWFFILTRRPFVVGDRIACDGQMGDVIDIRMFHTYLLECGQWVQADQSTGRVVMVPNSAVLIHPLINYTLRFDPIWDELNVTVTFESNWRKAKAILQEVVDTHAAAVATQAERQLRRAAGEHLIYYGKLTPIVYTSVRENGVYLSARYLTPPRARRSMAEKLWEEILERFAAAPDIHYAYPTTRFFTAGENSRPADS